MWADNETSIDLLGFQVHSDLICSVVTDPYLLPVTIGVFGDWGSGKSSVMKMLEQNLKEDKSVATIYFNGWQFEGYDDAKAALIHSILIELSDHTKVAEEAKSFAKGMLKQVNWLRVVNTGYQTLVAPFLASLIASQMGLPPTPVQPTTFPAITQEKIEKDLSKVDLTEILKDNPANSGLVGARKFRSDFQELIKKTNLDSIVILIDDLDRCEPKRLVETLEAIKLFLAVPHVAFVIGADERIIRYAIAKRYETDSVTQETKTGEGQLDLVTDYLEKLIQIPYHLPRLSQSEVETYLSLLFCNQHLKEKFGTVHQAFKHSRTTDVTSTYGHQHIQDALRLADIPCPDELSNQLAWCNMIAPTLSDVLKGNPRQTKRLLNALRLRQNLAKVAKLDNLSDQVLIKLMLLEYIRPKLFAQIYKWQATQNGFPSELVLLEKWGHSEDDDLLKDVKIIENSASWNDPSIKRWLTMPPGLSGFDLRNYFWITRDRVTGILSGISTIPLYLRRIILDLAEFEEDSIFSAELKSQIQQLSKEDINVLLDELSDRLKRNEEKRGIIATWMHLVEIIPISAVHLINCLKLIPVQSLPATLPNKIALVLGKQPSIQAEAVGLLDQWSQNKTHSIGRAAQQALSAIKKGNN